MSLHLIPTEKPLTLELNYQDMVDGVVFTRQGKAEIGFEVTPFDTSLYSEADMTSLQTQLMDILRYGVPERERLRIYCLPMRSKDRIVERYDSLLDTADAAAVAIHRERVDEIKAAQKDEKIIDRRMYITVTVSIGKKKRKPVSHTQAELTRIMERVRDVRNNLHTYLKEAGYKPKALRNEGVMELVHTFWNPDLPCEDDIRYEAQTEYLPHTLLKKQPHLAPSSLRSQSLSCDVKRNWESLRINDQYLRCVSVKGPLAPGSVIETGMIDGLLNIKECKKFVFCLDITHLDYDQALKALQSQARRLFASTNILGEYSDPAMVRKSQGLDNAIGHLSDTGEHIYECGITMWLIDERERAVKEAAKEFGNRVRKLRGLTPHNMNVGLFKLLKRTSPFSGESSHVKWNLIESDAQTLIPATGSYQGSGRPRVLLENRYDGLTSFDPFNPKLPNFNVVVAGKSGGGKSFNVQSFLLQIMKSDNVDLMITDQKQDYADMVRSMNGAVIPFGPGTGVQINPFDLEPGESEPDALKKSFLKAFIRSLAPYDGDGDIAKDNIIVEAIAAVYARNTNYRTNEEGRRETVFKGVTLTKFKRTLTQLEEIGEDKISAEDKRLASDLAKQLSQWTGDNPNAEMFDRQTNIALDKRVIYFDTSALGKYKELSEPAMLVMTDLIWKRVKGDPSRYKVVVMEELAASLKNDAAATFATELYRLARSYKGSMWSVTQSLEDYQSEETKGILGNTSTYILMQLDQEDNLVHEILGLPARAVRTFRQLRKKGGEYSELLLWLTLEDSSEGGIVVNRPGKLMYNLLTSSADERQRRSEIIDGETSGEKIIQKLKQAEKLAA